MILDRSPVRPRVALSRIGLALLISGLLALTGASDALAAGSSIKLRGPHLNLYGTSFHYTASGSASGRADHVYGWEVPYTPKCASTYKAESSRAQIALFVNKAVAKHKHFSIVIPFFARNTEQHRFCAYLVNKAGGSTLAHAETTWRNYSGSPTSPAPNTSAPGAGPLQPAEVGGGQCQAKHFPDESVFAQNAISGTSCEKLESVAYGADAAKGAAYTRAGFSCTASAEGAGSKWAAAWGGTYYAYTCSSGSLQVAFNWGTDYTYVEASSLPAVMPGG
jgi:hypothetical protein